MTESDPTREEDLRQLLTDAIEVQLAALKAGIAFWTEWIEQTSSFVQTATQTLANINTNDPAKDVILELVDAGRASARSLTEIPRNTATKFLEELDALEQQNQARKASAKTSRRRATSPEQPMRPNRPKRAGRVKG
jgi:hypothetical protein